MAILECPICSEPFSPPVFQCQSGHTVCSACRVKITKCPSCAQPVSTFIRNLLAEGIVESLQVRCPYAHHGCKQRLRFTDAEEHTKNVCAYRPCPCPVPGCIHEYPMQTLPLHLQEKGRRPPRQSEGEFRMTPREQVVMLRGLNGKVQLLVHQEVIEGLRTIYFRTCSEGNTVIYDFKVPGVSTDPRGEMNMNCLMLGASAGDIRRSEEWKRHVLLTSKPDPTQHGGGPLLHLTIPTPLYG